jgi:hypothetical protein
MGVPTALVDHGIYLDSPIVSAVQQIQPFFTDGIFSPTQTPVFLRMRTLVRMRLLFDKLPEGIHHFPVKPGKLPIADGGVVFYPFNSQSNMNVVTNRRAHHVLTLHGESNKLASNRPAARLYDYICIAGPIARDRYIDAGIFTKEEADQGRLVMVGDSFVQRLRWIEPALPPDDGALLYCPTWEGYGNGEDNYTSMSSPAGFELCAKASRLIGTNTIIVKPHPYLGLLHQKLLIDFIKGIQFLKKQGFIVKLALMDASRPLRLLINLLLRNVERVDETAALRQKIKLGLTDVSGIEAIFLQQHIPFMTIRGRGEVSAALKDYYAQKSLNVVDDPERSIRTYQEDAGLIDAKQRQQVFGWQDNGLEAKSGQERRAWLLNYVRNDPYWRPSKGKTP